MRYREFIGQVGARAAGSVDQPEATRATHAVLKALGQTLPPDRTRQLAGQLPKELQRLLLAGPARQPPVKVGEFLDLVAESEGLSRSEAFDHCRAVLNVMADAVTEHEMEHVRNSLPPDLATLFKPPAAAKWSETHTRRTW